MAQSGALTPAAATEEIYQQGLHHLSEPTQLAFAKNAVGGLLISMGGVLAFVAAAAGGGGPAGRLLQAAAWPAGLIAVYFVGAELYTGYPMWLAVAALQRRGRPAQYARALAAAWAGNLAGALGAAGVLTYCTRTLAEEPYRAGVARLARETVVAQPWHVVFLRAVGCGWLVTLAMFLGTQNKDGVSRALSLHLPFFISVAAEFPHTVEYMYVGALALMLGGSGLTIGSYLWKCLLPITLGNAVGGAALTGAYIWWVYIYCKDGEQAKDWFVGNGEQDEREDGEY